ncbi:transcription factor IIIA-like isoform X1 [Artemia franciscana]|uniref:transcription factor IIIA-like isoform X1 n=2 Tax=Artemia franciscana TaxID=6661 RepID=UPI0032DAEF3C
MLCFENGLSLGLRGRIFINNFWAFFRELMNRSKYQCNINGCQASFTRPWRLEAHIRVHQGAREFFCIEPDCGKAYFMQQHLKRHIVTFHQRPVESKKSSTNTICLVESASHGNTNTNDNCTGAETPFSCPVCSKKFKKHQQLKSHEYEHTGIKPFKCDKCDKSFLVSSKLKRHQKIHEGYRCSMDGCQEHFNTWSELLSHKSKAHKKSKFIFEFINPLWLKTLLFWSRNT